MLQMEACSSYDRKRLLFSKHLHESLGDANRDNPYQAANTFYTNAKDTITTTHQPGTTYIPALRSPRCPNQNQQRECEDFEVHADARCDAATQEDATRLATGCLSTGRQSYKCLANRESKDTPRKENCMLQLQLNAQRYSIRH
jgi:hypothetical protein